jgi:hypothetical protein
MFWKDKGGSMYVGVGWWGAASRKLVGEKEETHVMAFRPQLTAAFWAPRRIVAQNKVIFRESTGKPCLLGLI